MDKRIQRARNEQFIIRLASAYEGYTFFLPAFIEGQDLQFWYISLP